MLLSKTVTSEVSLKNPIRKGLAVSVEKKKRGELQAWFGRGGVCACLVGKDDTGEGRSVGACLTCGPWVGWLLVLLSRCLGGCSSANASQLSLSLSPLLFSLSLSLPGVTG